MRLFISALALVAALAATSHIAGAADAFPKFDIAKNCKAETADASGTGESWSSCSRDEEQAQQQLIQRWDQFAREDRTMCIRATSVDGTPSYVELKICLEMATDNKKRLKGT
jgi:hypothetical protein